MSRFTPGSLIFCFSDFTLLAGRNSDMHAHRSRQGCEALPADSGGDGASAESRQCAARPHNGAEEDAAHARQGVGACGPTDVETGGCGWQLVKTWLWGEWIIGAAHFLPRAGRGRALVPSGVCEAEGRWSPSNAAQGGGAVDPGS